VSGEWGVGSREWRVVTGTLGVKVSDGDEDEEEEEEGVI
jgi:hypothetical protein